MSLRRTVIRGADLESQLRALRAELAVPGDFPPAAIEEAAEVSAVAPPASAFVDMTEIPLVTLDPPGSRDLDQAFFVEQVGGGFRVTYAIADVATFVSAGGAIDHEARLRGETLYLPDGRVPLHPPVLSEGAASLLPGEVRPAVLWRVGPARGGGAAPPPRRRAPGGRRGAPGDPNIPEDRGRPG